MIKFTNVRCVKMLFINSSIEFFDYSLNLHEMHHSFINNSLSTDKYNFPFFLEKKYKRLQ